MYLITASLTRHLRRKSFKVSMLSAICCSGLGVRFCQVAAPVGG